ncbi:hypothetical protein ACYSNR_08350 [Enterococcus sp. LJL128]
MQSNEAWKKEIGELENFENSQALKFTLDELNSFFNKRLVDVYGCLIFSNRESSMSQENFEAHLKNFLDRTGYEASANEIRMIDFFEQSLTIQEQVQLARVFIQNINSRLQLLTSQRIIYIFGINDNILTTRFHQEWEDESSWLGDLEGFTSPIAVVTSEELPENFFKITNV